jgi:hypothetical protein
MSLAAADPALAPLPGVSAPRISWVNPPGGFAGLSILNGVLRILTLGVYHFWGKTEVRQRIWSAVRIDGEPLEYRGTGGELLRGFLVVFCLILLPMGVASLGASLLGPVPHAIYSFALWALLLLLSGIGIHRARAIASRARVGAASAAACPDARAALHGPICGPWHWYL